MKRWMFSVIALLLGVALGFYLAGPVLQGQAPQAPAIPKELTSYRDIVKKVLPGVVSIESRLKTKKPTRSRLPASDDRIPEEFRRFFENIPQQRSDDNDSTLGFGSGFLVDPKGVVMTNYHVVDGADHVEVQLTDGRKFSSKEIKTDAKTDLAIIKLDTKEALPFLEFGDSGAMEVGDRVLAVGAPFGLAGTVTCGIISAKDRSVRLNMYEDFLQTDAAINPGNSGGPLVNMEGKVIGINAAIKSKSGGFQGVGLAIPSNMARDVAPKLIKDGIVKRGYLGVQIKDLIDLDAAKKLGVGPEGGVMVTAVFEKSPSEKAGLKEGDVITSLGGKPVKETRALQLVVAGLPLGKPVDLTIVRDGKPQTLQVTIDEQPDDFGTPRVAPKEKKGSSDE